MKLLFVVERNLYYRFYGPLINEALNRGHDVWVLHNYGHPYLNLKNPKSLYFPFLNQIPQFRWGTIIPYVYREKKEVQEFINANNLDVVLSLHPKSFYMIEDINAKWYCLQHGQDSFLPPYRYADEGIFVYSKNWLTEKWLKENPSVNVIECGFYHYHASDFFSPSYVRQKYGLPDKKVFLYIPLDFIQTMQLRNPIKKLYLYYIYLSETNILKKIKQFCDKHGFHIVIKSRFKRILRKKYNRYGTVLHDESIYPATIEELVYIADITLSDFYYSTVVAEAIFHKSRYITVTYDYLEYDMTYAHRRYWPEAAWRDVFLPEGLNYLIKSSDFSVASLERIMNEEYDSLKREKYVRKYLLPSNQLGVSFIMDYIEQNQ